MFNVVYVFCLAFFAAVESVGAKNQPVFLHEVVTDEECPIGNPFLEDIGSCMVPDTPGESCLFGAGRFLKSCVISVMPYRLIDQDSGKLLQDTIPVQGLVSVEEGITVEDTHVQVPEKLLSMQESCSADVPVDKLPDSVQRVSSGLSTRSSSSAGKRHSLSGSSEPTSSSDVSESEEEIAEKLTGDFVAWIQMRSPAEQKLLQKNPDCVMRKLLSIFRCVLSPGQPEA